MEGMTEVSESIKTNLCINVAKVIKVIENKIKTLNKTDIGSNNNQFYLMIGMMLLFGFLGYIYVTNKKENHNQLAYQNLYINYLENKLKNSTKQQYYKRNNDLKIEDVSSGFENGNYAQF